MANAQKGEVSLVIGERTYTMQMNINAICELEEHLSTPDKLVTLQDVVAGMLKGSNRHTRAFFWAAFREHHPGLDVKAVGALIAEAGGMDAFILLARGLVQSTKPDPADLKTLGVAKKAASPTAASVTTGDHAAGTGAVSSSRLAARGSRGKRSSA